MKRDGLFWFLVAIGAVYLVSQSQQNAGGMTPAPTVSPVPLGPPNVNAVQCTDASGIPYYLPVGPCPPGTPGGATGTF